MRRTMWLLAGVLVASGCGPTPPKVILETPKDFPAKLGERKLYHTPQAYIYARTDVAAGEADQWVKEVRDYVQRKYQRDLGKGVVIVMDPADEPIVQTLEEEMVLERDPTLITAPPRKPKSIAEIRKKLADEGVPEGPSIRGTTIPLSGQMLRRLGLNLPDMPWAVAAPGHELAVECGIDVGTSVFRKKKPELTPEQARKMASMVSGTLAKSFEIVRGEPVLILWVQRQDDWPAEQKREEIRERIRHTFRANWLPAPKEEDLEW
jgi:hypothetical protein